MNTRGSPGGLSGDAMLRAELNQARALVQKAMAEREAYIRICAVLARGVTSGATFKTVDGNVAIKKSAFDAVPKAFRVDLQHGSVASESADPNAPPEEMIVVVVSDAPEPPVLHLPTNGRA